MNFNKSIIPTPIIHRKELGKIAFLLGDFPAIFVVLGTILSLGVTLVTAKKQHCGWNARTYSCTYVAGNSCVRALGVDEYLRATGKP